MPVRGGGAAASRRRSSMMSAARNRRWTIKESVRDLFANKSLRSRRQEPPPVPQGPMGPIFQKEKVDGEGECDDSDEKQRVQDPRGGLHENNLGGGAHPHQGSAAPHRPSMANNLSSMSERFMDNVMDNVSVVRESKTVTFCNKFRKLMGEIINDWRVQYFILALIIINAIMMGVATFPIVKENPSTKSTFELIDRIFLSIFTIECSMQLIYHGWTLFKDGWLVFDLLIVAISWAFDKIEGLQVARAFRIFRALRLIARIDVMRNLITALVSVIPRVNAIILLLALVFYIFGVVFTLLYKDASKTYPRIEQYFVALPETWFTLFQIMTLDEWVNPYGQAYEELWWSWILFIGFVVISAFIFANLIIAVICDGVRALDDKELAGLTGFEEDQVDQHKVDLDVSHKNIGPSTKNSSKIQELREMEKHLDEIVMMNVELMDMITSIVTAYNLEMPSKQDVDEILRNNEFNASLESFPTIIEYEEEDSPPSSQRSLVKGKSADVTEELSNETSNGVTDEKATQSKNSLQMFRRLSEGKIKVDSIDDVLKLTITKSEEEA